MSNTFGRKHDEAGNVLIVAVMIASVAMALTLVVVGTALNTQRASGVDRQEAASVAGAEAGVDASYALIQSSGFNLPCTWPPAGSATLGTTPDTTTVRATIKYLTESNPTPRCPLLSGERPVSAVILSQAETQTLAGGTTHGDRGMESAVNLTPIYGNGFDSAMFADGTLSIDSGGKVKGNVGNDGTLYSNTTVRCENGTNREIYGSIFSQGDVAFNDWCFVGGDVWASGKVTSSKKTAIEGNVRAKAGPITLHKDTSVGKNLYSGSDITWDGCTSDAKCVRNADPGAPLAKPFPELYADAGAIAQWTGTGVDPVTGDPRGEFALRIPPSCVDVESWVLDGAATWTSKSLVVTDCPLNFAQQTRFDAKYDLAIFARKGMHVGQQTILANGGTGIRNIYWMVPFESAPRPCSTPTIHVEQRTKVNPDVRLLIYSPCDVTIQNNGDFYGQVYSGSNLYATNSFDLSFRPVPVFGVKPESKPTLSYRLDVVYKREQS